MNELGAIIDVWGSAFVPLFPSSIFSVPSLQVFSHAPDSYPLLAVNNETGVCFEAAADIDFVSPLPKNQANR
ncbi:hypothetical protein V6N13_016591 [Hibiscus sabdariffa]